jgi:Ca2+-binding EF-hand superfamily protein/thiol-disulfide isomerase/thioredoxin
LAVSTSSHPSATFAPELGSDGLYHLQNKEQHAELMKSVGQDKIVVLKVYAPWCRACKALEAKFLQVRHDPKYSNLPIVWADLTIQHNKEFIKQLGVLALPTVQFYVQGRLIDTFPCGPSKVPILKRKLASTVNTHVDPGTMQLKPLDMSAIELSYQEGSYEGAEMDSEQADDATVTTPAATSPKALLKSPYRPAPAASAKVDLDAELSAEDRKHMESIPYFSELSLADRDEVAEKATLVTFAPGSIILREGTPGNSFYMLSSGSVEICQAATYLSDPLVSPPPSYLGTVINVLENPGDYFGERALLTGEPRAASIRASDQETKVWVWDKKDFPASSVLSGRTKFASARNVSVDDKYGLSVVSLQSDTADWQQRTVNVANQVRGSTNSPYIIRGVDTDDDVEYDEELLTKSSNDFAVERSDEVILSLLSKFKMVRSIRNCLNYLVKTRATWGDSGNRIRRSLLVSRLTPAQRAEFAEAFEFSDANGDGQIELQELKRIVYSMHSGEEGENEALDQELQVAIERNSAGPAVLDYTDFMGIMAESEFYFLFNDIFASLDTNNSGYVKAMDLDRVLSGVRDLISDDRNSIIDVEDQDMLIDYEQFTRMLLGTSLQ